MSIQNIMNLISQGLGLFNQAKDLIEQEVKDKPRVVPESIPVDGTTGQPIEVVGNTNIKMPVTRAIPWGKQCQALHPDFIDGLLWIESQINLKPEELIPCMKFESNLNPKARNPQSSASGLIQFMAATATNLGTTIEAIREMDAMGQLSWVYKYFRNQRADWTGLTAADVYMAILWPKALGKPDSYKVWTAGSDAYAVNKGLDLNKDGMVTKAEAAYKVLQLQKQGFEPGNVLNITV